MAKLRVTIVTPCWNEEDNILAIFEAVQVEIQKANVEYEHLFIDNCSTDSTREILKTLAAVYPQVKVIFNSRNYGPVRSPFYGLLQARGDAAILIAADFQEPPQLIPELIEHWKNGQLLVAAVKTSSEESFLRYRFRQLYYSILSKISDTPLLEQFTGFALYDRKVLEELRACQDPFPYLRGLVSELGFVPYLVEYHQPLRKAGYGKGGVKNLVTFALLGIVNHSKLPLRIATTTGFLLAIVSLTVAIVYLVYKLLFWNDFEVGMAPLVIGLFFFSSVQLLFLGIVGEYVGAILTQVKRRPLVLESERINFDSPTSI
jgi:glycosyltransferase involved in cell wall biosynthesis